MASSSTSSIRNSYKYDVFLSFRGEDTRKNFVDHLYDALERRGIRTFKDDERLNKGKRIKDELLKSIEESKFCIIVFSKNYASSSWCLDELVKIMECKKGTEQFAYPVFYDVDTSFVRNQRGPVGNAFSIAKYKNKGKAVKWREALEEAANLSGWDVRNTSDGHEAKVINKIVEKISLELLFNNVEVDGKLVGMERRIKDIVSSLEAGVEDVCMIGIKGIGGGGKTTLARSIFDNICCLFECKSFVENVREVSKASSSGLRSLQEQVLSNVLNGTSFSIGSVHEGKSVMKKMLCRNKVLLVLDDVDHLEQLEALAGGLDWFKPGSRIIITTRDEQVLVAHRVKWIHDVNLLSDDEALCLFSRYAFGRDIPVQTYKELSLHIVHYADGLPLTIKVLGSSLCGKDKLEWTDALKRLKTIPLKETLEKLELSYTSLEDDFKEIFLDAACLLKGWPIEDAIRALESSGFHARYGLRVLVEKSLITVSHDQRLGMHDHLEEMGQNIVRRSHPYEPIQHSRLWNQREIEHVLADNSVTEATRAIALKTISSHGEENHISKILAKGLGNMKKLRFLHLGHDNYISFEVGQSFPNALQFLSWQGYPHLCLPKTFEANNLVALEMPFSNIEYVWGDWERKVLNNLKFLDLSHSRLTTLDCSLFPKLERLNLEGCHHLKIFYKPIGSLSRLLYLGLKYCEYFNNSRLSFIKQLESLQVLDLSFLHMKSFPSYALNYHLLELNFSGNYIQELPSAIGNLQKLVSLDLTRCIMLKILPQSICSLRCLKNLKLGTCAIEELPKDLDRLECLETLDLSDTIVRRLPNSIFMLKHLKILLLTRCKLLEKLHEDIGQLESLEELSLAFCWIRDVPNTICKLKHLSKFDLSYCLNLQKLPETLGDLKCLKVLNVKGTCTGHLPRSISLLEGLEII